MRMGIPVVFVLIFLLMLPGYWKPEYEQLICPAALDFYSKNGPINPFVEVRAGTNIANKDGLDVLEKRFFSKQDLSAGQKLTIYSGEVYSERPHEGRYMT